MSDAALVTKTPPDGFDEDGVQVVSSSALGVLARGEVEAQLDAAHKYRRSIQRFTRDTLSLATITQDVAESCLYAVPRDGKMIAGPSVRLAEIAASCYGNMHVAARIVDVTDKEVVAQGVVWDLEKNLRVSVETRRRITKKSGARYSDDMITTTGNAAASIALRNAIFRVIPRALIGPIYDQVKKVAVGDAQTLIARRGQILERLARIGVSLDRVLARLGKVGPEDIGLDDLEVLIALGAAVKNGDQNIDDAFPAPAAAVPGTAPGEEGKRISMKGNKPKADEPKPETKPEPPPAERQPGDD